MATKVPNPVDKYVGSRVRMRRQILGMSQGKLADKLRLTFQQVQKYEKGTNRISASRLQEMSYICRSPCLFLRRRPAERGPRREGRSGSVPRLRL
jgi:transcriptional regulator with XRE-family HTH domain